MEEVKFVKWDSITIEEYRKLDPLTQDEFWNNAPEIAKASIVLAFTKKDFNYMNRNSQLVGPSEKTLEEWQEAWRNWLIIKLDTITEPF